MVSGKVLDAYKLMTDNPSLSSIVGLMSDPQLSSKYTSSISFLLGRNGACNAGGVHKRNAGESKTS